MLDACQDTKIICLTPVKNEAWILDTFLSCASLWADQIIIADQMSTDGSREIAIKYPKVTLIDNACGSFNEPERQALLIDAARKINCDRRVLIALDADEILVGNVQGIVCDKFSQFDKGTVITFDWFNVQPDRHTCWKSNTKMPFGFIDDETKHCGATIHSTRVPDPGRSHHHPVTDIFVLHLQYIDWDRMRSKHRWYECFERINHQEKASIEIYRQYHHMYSFRNRLRRFNLRKEWLSLYNEMGIDALAFIKDPCYRWDTEILEMIKKYGADKFINLDIWDSPVFANSKEILKFANQGIAERLVWTLVRFYLKLTQLVYPNFFLQYVDRLIGKVYH